MINLLLAELLIGVNGLVALLHQVARLLLVPVVVVRVLGWLHLSHLVLAHHLVLILLLASSHKMDIVVLGVIVATGGTLQAASILP